MSEATLTVHGESDATPDGGRPAPVVETLAAITIFSQESGWVEEVEALLEREGFEVTVDVTGDSAFGDRADLADAAILHLGRTTRVAGEICSAWHHRTDAPVLMVSADDDEVTVLHAYATGADQFATTRISGRQLVARLRSLLRRSPVRHGEEVTVDLPVVLDEHRTIAFVKGVKVALTQGEYELARRLLRRPGHVVTRAELLEVLRPNSPRLTERSVDFFVRRLREKFEAIDDERRIVAVRGVGFRFEIDDLGDGTEVES